MQLMNIFQKNYDMLLAIFNPEGWLEITYPFGITDCYCYIYLFIDILLLLHLATELRVFLLNILWSDTLMNLYGLAEMTRQTSLCWRRQTQPKSETIYEGNYANIHIFFWQRVHRHSEKMLPSLLHVSWGTDDCLRLSADQRLNYSLFSLWRGQTTFFSTATDAFPIGDFYLQLCSVM
jgi:hypothetical protein